MADFTTLINSHTPTAYWRLDETTGLTADDPAGSHDGIYQNGTVLAEEAGPLNGGGTSAPHFDGVNDYVEAATDASFNLPAGTFQIWMKSDAFGVDPRALASSGSDGNVAGSFFLALNDGDKGQMVFRLQDGTSNKFVWTDLNVIAPDQWHHVAVTWGSGGMKIYVDGTLSNTSETTSGADYTGGVAFTGDPITIGASQMFSAPGQAEPTDRFFKGNLAEAAFFDQALSDGEIADLYNAGILGDISNIATDDVAATDEDSTVDIDVLDNDSGPSNVTDVDTDGTAGAVTINPDDTVTYDPNGAFDYLAAGETATDSFNYTVKKGGENDLGSVTVTITGVNDAPDANDDVAETEKDSATTITVLANDDDADASNTLNVTSVNTAGTAGSVVVNANNSITYDPNGAFDGLGADATATDTFTYKITDDAGVTSTATVTVTISGDTAAHDGGYLEAVTDHTPIAYWRLGEGAGFTADDLAGGHDGVYRNGTELATVSGPLAGEATVAPHFDGSNDFVEAATDASFNLPEGTFQIWMKSDAFGGDPRALVSSGSIGNVEGSILVAQNPDDSGQIAFRLQDGTNDKFVWTPLNTITPDQWHHVAVSWGSGGMKIYVDGVLHMTEEYTGGVAFTGDPITIGASQKYSAPGQAEPTDRFFKGNLAEAAFFNEALDADEIVDLYDAGLRASTADLANNDVAAVDENATVDIDVLDNDDASTSVSGVDGAELAGTVTLNGDDTITYDPNGQFEHLAAGETATETFRYSVSDGNGGLDVATATVTIHGENDAPVATKDTARTEKDASTTLTLVANDEDADDSDVLSVVSIDDSATQGTVTLNADGTVTYDPNGAFDHLGDDEQSADHFSYTVSDGKGGTDTATVTIAIGKSDAVAATPDALNGLVLWLDAADETTITETGGGVSEWRDKSGNDYHQTQTDAASRPEYVDGLLHGFGGIRLDGTNDFLTGNLDGLSLDGMTLLVVADFKETEGFNGVLSVFDENDENDWGSDDAFVLDSGEVENSVSLRRNHHAEDSVYVQDHGLGGEGPHILVATVGGGVATMEIDGHLMEVDLYEGHGSLDPTNSLIGGRWHEGAMPADKFGENDMFDVLLFDRVLTDDEIDSLYAYLGEKWNVSVEDTAIDYQFVPFAGQSNANRHFTPSDSGEVRFEQEFKALTGGTLVDAFNVSTGASSADRIAVSSWAPDRYWWDIEADVPGQLLLNAVQDILDSGLTPNGIVWAQGEQDGTSLAGDTPQQTTIARYKLATEKIFNYFRSELNDPDLQIYIQEIGTDGDTDRDAAYDLIRAAQQEMADDLANVHIAAVTEDLERVDNVHFTEEGYKIIAERLASYIAEDQATLPEPVEPPAVEGDSSKIGGSNAGDWSGYAVSGAGDVNGDGFDDVIIGAPMADIDGKIDAGQSYVVFGSVDGVDSSIDLATLDGTNGFRIDGIESADLLGRSVRGVGDVNNDGIDDFIVGAEDAVPQDFRVLSVNSSVTDEITSGKTEKDWFQVSLIEGETYQIDLEGLPTDAGTLTDPYLRQIYDSTGAPTGIRDDNGGVGWNSMLTFTAPTTGNYYLEAGTRGATDTGTYTLSVKATADVSASAATTGTVDVGGSVTGEITGGKTDKDWFKVSLVEGETYQIDLEGAPTDAGTLTDPYLRQIYDSTGAPTGIRDDNSGVGWNSKLMFTATSTGDYYLEAGTRGATDTGTYTLSVKATDDFSASTSTTGTVDVGGSATGEITGGKTDKDWFKVSLIEGETYQIDLEGAPTDAGTLTDPYLRQIYDSTGTPTGIRDDNGGAGQNSKLLFTATATGDYYLEAGTRGTTDTGTYTLSVKSTADLSEDILTAGNVSVGSSVTGEITGGKTDKDWFRVSMVEGETYQIDLEGLPTDAGTLTDPYLRQIYDSTGAPTGIRDDNGGVGLNSMLTFTAPSTGDYFLEAGTRGATDTGTYTLSVTVAAELSASASTTRHAGEAHVVFGQADGFDSVIDLTKLDGTNGFTIEGQDAGDHTGIQVSGAGDINGDGIADLLIGAHGADGNGFGSGSTYVVYGDAAGYDPVFDLNGINGSNGFRLDGVKKLDQAGIAVRQAGDVNGDGYADVIIGASSAARGSENHAGEAYVVFGGEPGSEATVDLAGLDGTNGFRLLGLNAEDWFGSSVSGGGDINGDGFDDVIVGAPGGDPAGKADGGEAFVIFGKASGFDPLFDITQLDGTNGFRLDGQATGDQAGFRVDFAGDVNGDGFADLLIGAPRADVDGQADAGATMVVFGKADGFDAAMSLQDLDEVNGFLIEGESGNGLAGSSVSAAGDVNGDGYDDIIVGAPRADDDGQAEAGMSYVVYGRNFNGAVTLEGDGADNVINGTANADVVVAGDGDDVVHGNGGADVLRGGAGDDILAVSDGAFQQLIGGNGLDTVRLEGNGMLLDLQSIPDNRIDGIEQFDLNGGGNTLVLNALELANLSDESNTLVVLGGNNDALEADLTGFAAESDGGFTTYTNGVLTLTVDNDVDQQNILIS